MNVRFVLLFAFLLIAVGLFAQRPETISIEKASKHDPGVGQKVLACDRQFAGNIFSITPRAAQSNDVDKDTAYLCFSDSMFIDHAGDYNLQDDPSPATSPGIGYIFYDCRPTATGPNLRAIQTDPCTNRTSPILINGQLITQNQGVWVAAQNSNGDAMFRNDGNLIQGFGGGNPVQFWFAPVTLDEFANRGFYQDPVSREIGPCVNANTNAAFRVVYLTKINATQRTVSGCEASFRLTGGFPHFRPSATYSIVIAKSNNPSIRGTITTGVPRHNSDVRFTVPEPGDYVVNIEDGKSCGETFTMSVTGCNGINISTTNEIVLPGNRVCVDVFVENFVNVGSMQATIEWDPNIIQFDAVELIPAAFPGFDAGSYAVFGPTGAMTISWNEPSFQGLTLPDGTVIFRICFIAVGPIGSSSPIRFTSNLTEIDIRDPVGNRIGFTNNPIGKVFISNRNLITEYVMDTTCFGQTDGGFSVRVFGGQPPYAVTYQLLPAGPIIGPFNIANDGGTFTATNVPPGNYDVNITDSSPTPVTQTDNIIVPERPQLTANILPVQNILCHGDENGILRAFPLVNNIPVPEAGYQFQWNNGSNLSVISNLAPRQYVVTVTDPFGCEATANFTLQDQSKIDFVATLTRASCTGRSDGGINISTITGGVSGSGNYAISIRGPSNFNFNSTDNNANINGLTSGNYAITITDDNGCQLDTTLRLNDVKALNASVVLIRNVTCAGSNDGRLQVQGATLGGVPATPYTFAWFSAPPVPPANITNTATTSALTNLGARSYQLQMTDTDGCRLDTTFTITEPDSLKITVNSVKNESCAPGGDGEISVTVTGGTALGNVYTYDLGLGGRTFPPNHTLTNLTAANYVLTVTDDNMCRDTIHFRINTPTPPTITAFADVNLNCASDNNGVLAVTAQPAGSPIVNYSWSNGQSGANLSSISNLSPACYQVTVTAADGCTAVDTACVIAPPAMQIDSSIISSPTCPGDANGVVIVFVSGGTQPYSFRWSTNPAAQGAQVLAGVPAGTYFATITDANNCPPLVERFIVNDPPSIRVQLTLTDTVSCYQATCDGGASAVAIYSNNTSGTFNFTWSSGETTANNTTSAASMLCQGIQSVSVSDGACGVVGVIDIPSKQPLLAEITAIPVSCYGRADGEARINITGGEGPFSVNWSNGDAGNIADDLPAGSVTCNVTDVNGCTFSSNVLITEPDVFAVQVDIGATRDVRCNGGDDGLITVVTNGGNPGNFSFFWSGNVAPANTNVATDLVAGAYSITVEDSRGCTATTTHTLNEPLPITFDLDAIEPIKCFGYTTLVQPINVAGGNGPGYAYSINDQPKLDVSLPTSVFAETYTMTVFDSRDCVAETTFTVNQPDPIVINLDPLIEVELGDSTQLRPRIDPGGPPINVDSIFWTPSLYLSCDRCKDPVVTPLESQTYFITVYDFNGCSATGQITVEVDKNRNVYIPNAFSPNGDGPNDEFRIYTGVGVATVNSVRVFDRWGDILYEATDLTPSNGGIPTWDGTFKGKQVDPAVFVYLIEVTFLDGLKLLYRGDITLLR